MLLATVAAVVILGYTVKHLPINTDSADMLAKDLPWRHTYSDYKRAFPQQVDTILIVIDGDTADESQDAATLLTERLKQEPQIFKSVYYRNELPFFRANGLLYLETSELEDLTDNLATVQPFLSKLSNDQSVRGLFAMLSEATRALVEGTHVELGTVFERIHDVLDAALHQRRYRLSWQDVMSGTNTDPKDHRQFIIVQPELDFNKLLPAERAVNAIRSIVTELGMTQENGVRVRLTGDAPLSYEELLSAVRGMGVAAILSFAMITIVLWVGLGSMRLVLITLYTLICGLIYTAGFAAVAIGELNLISIAFAILVPSLGDAFCVHFCLRYRELLQEYGDHARALHDTVRQIGGALLLCALTTAIGFYAFIPTSFVGVAELGLIAGTGIFINFGLCLSLLPALLGLVRLAPTPHKESHRISRAQARLLSFPMRHARVVVSVTLVLGLCSLFLLLYVAFDPDTLNLKDPSTESVITFRELLKDKNSSPWRSTLLAKSRDEANRLKDQLDALPVVDKVVTLDSFIPADQDEKLLLVEDMGLIIGPTLQSSNDAAQPSAAEQEEALRKFQHTLQDLIQAHPDSSNDLHAQALNNILQDFLERLDTLAADDRAQLLAELQESLIGTLPGRLQALKEALRAKHVTVADLPHEFVKRWVTPNGRYLIEVFPNENLEDNSALRRFVTALQGISPEFSGPPIINIEAGDAVVSAFQQAFLYALFAIGLLLVLLLDRKIDALFVLLPLLLGGVLTAAASVVLNIPFNFANIIALPLLLGIGVDSGIHMVHQYRTAPPKDGVLLATTSGRAVFFSALTTVVGFANLAFTPHQGMASMGKLLALGITLTLVCTLVVLPALLAARGNDTASDPTRSA
ncbi:MAG: MMPL family transporter [Gammaproteobacteria bacterium]|nr:MMPL family transporter [Gammaproteobacteria bacterium]